MNERSFDAPATEPANAAGSPPRCSGCAAADPARRSVLRQFAAGAMAMCGAAGHGAVPNPDPPREGDWLVPVDADELTPLTPADIKPDARQIVVWPADPLTRKLRDGSRLNRIIVIRIDAAALDASARARSVDGVLAFSGICTHQGCDVSSWRPAEKTLLCFCHFSQFQPADGGAVVAGPAPRALPTLPLRSDGSRLLLAGGFSEAPGAMT